MEWAEDLPIRVVIKIQRIIVFIQLKTLFEHLLCIFELDMVLAFRGNRHEMQFQYDNLNTLPMFSLVPLLIYAPH